MPLLVRKAAGSNSSSASGFTASSTRGSARDASAWATAIQMESRVRGSELIIDWSESAQPFAAAGWLERIPTASAAAEGASDHSNSVLVESRSSAAACRSAWRAERVLPSQNPPDSTPPEDSPVEDDEAGGADHRGQRFLTAADG